MIQIRKEQGLVNNHPDGAAWFEWWISDQTQEEAVDENQLTLDDVTD